MAGEFPTHRDPIQWPFADTSIWNMPIGGGADYVAASIPAHDRIGPEEEIVILTPDAPKVSIRKNTAGWNRELTRCETITSEVLETNVPVPDDFSTDPGYYGLTPNQSAAILLSDGRTIIQNQPFHRCGAGGTATSQYVFPRVDLYGEAIAGSHGGAGMSAIGGCIRSGELVPGATIRHALKLILYAKLAYYYRSDESDGKAGYRWPAFRADAYANTTSYAGANPAVQIGTLLCLKPDFNVSGLSTEPARIIAKALQDYGAYIIDDAAWSWIGLAVEWGPGGREMDEFRTTWGFDLATQLNTGSAWANDIKAVMNSLYVVDNNGPSTKGGGGTPRQPLAPPFGTTGLSGAKAPASAVPPQGSRLRRRFTQTRLTVVQGDRGFDITGRIAVNGMTGQAPKQGATP